MQARAQVLDRSRASDLVRTSLSTVELPDAPNPHGSSLNGVDLITPLIGPANGGVAHVPPTPRQAFIAATRTTFGPSAYGMVELTSLIAEAENQHPALGKGLPGLWAYSWRGFVDRADGNYWVIFALPSILHEDERFQVMQHGHKFYRLMYACSRVLITRDFRGNRTINVSELLGRGASQAISISYYPDSDRNAESLAGRYGYALLSDAATNALREFRTDIETHVLHRRF